MTERILSKNEPAYMNMVYVAEKLTSMSKHGAQYIVENVYLDFGQNWIWTTITRYGYRECQVLSPKEWQDIVMADHSELDGIAERIRNGKYFGDK